MKALVMRRPSPAMVVALLALSVALGGSAFAAVSLPRNSVGTEQLKRGAVTTSKLRRGTTAPNAAELSGVAASRYARIDVEDPVVTISDVIPAQSCAAQGVVAPGAKAGDIPLLALGSGTPTYPAGVFFSAVSVPSDDHATINLCNVTTSAQPVPTVGFRMIFFH